MDKEEMLLLLDELAKEIAFNNWFDKSKSRAYIVTLGESCPDCKAELVRECNFCHNCGQSIRRG